MAILSGLYGVLRPLDLMQPYRLEMGTRLETPKGKTLYDYWGSSIAQYLNERQEGQKSPVIVNLASEEYFKSVDLKALKARVVQCVFQDWKNGTWKIISFHAKRARGLMARYAIPQRSPSPKGCRASTWRVTPTTRRPRRTTSWCSGASSEPWLAVVKMAAFGAAIFWRRDLAGRAAAQAGAAAPGACAGSSSASSSWRIMWLALIICLSGYASAACSPSVSNWSAGPAQAPASGFRPAAGPCRPAPAHRRGRLRQRRQDRDGGVICEASTWFWISRLFSSGTLT